MSEPRDALAVKWYAHPNDVIGGWCVMPVDQSPSTGEWEVADFVSEAAARHIAELHNAWLGGALERAVERANRNARLAADNADERDTAAERMRECIANRFDIEADLWRIRHKTEAPCEYDRAAQMVRDFDDLAWAGADA